VESGPETMAIPKTPRPKRILSFVSSSQAGDQKRTPAANKQSGGTPKDDDEPNMDNDELDDDAFDL